MGKSNLQSAAAILGAKGGKAGNGAAKSRSAELRRYWDGPGNQAKRQAHGRRIAKGIAQAKKSAQRS